MLNLETMLATGATYRQLDFWSRSGYLRAVINTPGVGNRRQWLDGEDLVAATMVRLAAAGLIASAAERVARGEAEIAPGVWVLIAPVEVEAAPTDLDAACVGGSA